jgi:hypothetical protein
VVFRRSPQSNTCSISDTNINSLMADVHRAVRTASGALSEPPMNRLSRVLYTYGIGKGNSLRHFGPLNSLYGTRPDPPMKSAHRPAAGRRRRLLREVANMMNMTTIVKMMLSVHSRHGMM